MLNKVLVLKRAHSREEGFTLIELMIVVVIIGILAAIAIPIFANQQRSAQDATLKQDMRTTNMALSAWMAKGNRIANATYVDPTFQYILKYHRGAQASFPSMPGGGVEKQFMAGLDDFTITDGSRIGVKVSVPSVGYCIAGARDGSNFDSISAGAGTYDTNRMLFYDSATGKMTDRKSLTADGACEYFASN